MKKVAAFAKLDNGFNEIKEQLRSTMKEHTSSYISSNNQSKSGIEINKSFN